MLVAAPIQQENPHFVSRHLRGMDRVEVFDRHLEEFAMEATLPVVDPLENHKSPDEQADVHEGTPTEQATKHFYFSLLTRICG